MTYWLKYSPKKKMSTFQFTMTYWLTTDYTKNATISIYTYESHINTARTHISSLHSLQQKWQHTEQMQWSLNAVKLNLNEATHPVHDPSPSKNIEPASDQGKNPRCRARTRGGRRQKLCAQRRELFMLLNITTDMTQRAAYREQLKALREPPRPQRKAPEDTTPRQSEARTTTYYNKYYNKKIN